MNRGACGRGGLWKGKGSLWREMPVEWGACGRGGLWKRGRVACGRARRLTVPWAGEHSGL